MKDTETTHRNAEQTLRRMELIVAYAKHMAIPLEDAAKQFMAAQKKVVEA